MFAQRILDLERGDLVAAGLDDVDARAAQQPVHAVLQHRHIAGEETIRRGTPRVSRGRRQYSENTDGPRTSSSPDCRRRPAVPASLDEPHLDARQRNADEPGRRSPRNGFDRAMPISVMP